MDVLDEEKQVLVCYLGHTVKDRLKRMDSGVRTRLHQTEIHGQKQCEGVAAAHRKQQVLQAVNQFDLTRGAHQHRKHI